MGLGVLGCAVGGLYLTPPLHPGQAYLQAQGRCAKACVQFENDNRNDCICARRLLSAPPYALPNRDLTGSGVWISHWLNKKNQLFFF